MSQKFNLVSNRVYVKIGNDKTLTIFKNLIFFKEAVALSCSLDWSLSVLSLTNVLCFHTYYAFIN